MPGSSNPCAGASSPPVGLIEPGIGNVFKTVCFYCLQKIAAVSDCEKSSSAAIVECLREKTEEELVQIALKMVGEMILLVFK